jgi:uncharacterized Tic20 family protein
MAQTAQHAVFDPCLAPGRILLWHHDRQEEPVVNPYEPPASPVEPIPSTSADERTWAMIAHFAALGAFIIPVIGGVLGPLFVFWLVMTVIAGIKASEGVPYRYPVSLRLVK